MYSPPVVQDDEVLDKIAEYLECPTRYGHYITALCPFHSDSRPSFFVYADTYKCASCMTFGKTSKLLEVLQAKHGVFMPKQVDYFHSPWRKWLSAYKDISAIVERSHDHLLRYNKTSYLSKRKITLETIKILHIGWLDDWIVIPFYDEDHNIIGATARAGETNKSTAKYVNPANQNPNLLYVPSWRLIDAKSKVYCVFGILDAISLYQIGVASVSSTTGKHVDPRGLDQVQKCIVVIGDHGEEQEANLLSCQLGWRGSTLVPTWPDGSKDCNDVLCKHGEQVLWDLISGA